MNEKLNQLNVFLKAGFEPVLASDIVEGDKVFIKNKVLEVLEANRLPKGQCMFELGTFNNLFVCQSSDLLMRQSTTE